jgi:DNA-directed RNA polymerase specialized sigma24 family protein
MKHQLSINNSDIWLETRLRYLIKKACRYSSKSLKFRHFMTEIVKTAIASGKILKNNSPDYEEALQITWLYILRNIRTYDPNRSDSNFMRWFNSYLKWRLRDLHINRQKQQQQTDRIDNLPAPTSYDSIVPAIAYWVKTDVELSQISLKKHPEITCKFLILRRLLEDSSWKELAEELGVGISTLSSFYRRQCLPRLRSYCDRYYLC